MIIDTESENMKCILIKFLKDSLDFLSCDSTHGFQRGKWAEAWMDKYLKEEIIKEWMPQDDH